MDLTCKYNSLHFLIFLAFASQYSHGRSSRSKHRWQNGTTKDCCSWDGVTCDHSGFVVGLNLSYSSLSAGDIDAIFNLRHLQRLNLAGNNFQLTPIPSGLERLSNLTHLNLSFSCFSDQVPAGISSLVRLESLDLSTVFFCELPPTFNDPDYNRIFAFEEKHRLRLDKPNLESFVRNLRALTELNLDYVDLSAQGSSWSQALSVLPNLKFLSLSTCKLKGPIHTYFQNLKFLNTLKLHRNNLSSEIHLAIWSLTNLLLYTCNFSGLIPPSFANLTSATEVDISYNSIEGSIPSFRPSSLPKLQDQHLSFNRLTGPIDPHLFTLPSLKVLYLNDNRFSGELREFSSSSSVLEKVYLNGNNLSGEIPTSMSEITSLTYLSLASNRFTGSVKLEAFKHLSNLTSLDLSFNSLNIKNDDPDLMFPSLDELKLSRCNLTEFPTFLKKQEQLRTLNLSNNRIQGHIPDWLWTGYLNELDLSDNEVDFPRESSQVNTTFSLSLGILAMRSCSVFKFPKFLQLLDCLWYLDLSGNKIKGQQSASGITSEWDLQYEQPLHS
ncbi:receptor-like protein 7 [Salvia hispanica]|uniref:receptor-like protein 7 n=1 Tax=Salvia hispanica TaxID=49212 RepID=UPI002009CB90|nr:receptor-like protein 7 [Salvia hispanica]